ncbi:alginate O-acetyltransferase complex protein AlgI [Dysgonomonas sp. PH5-45]|uniref:MBOAT family O-acyltransferase n=1 Tax=unclassified Dysgonomonas TaxID=2630389 RepID=UPI002474EA2C|nr:MULTISPECIES: MBOAT family O-acyltransferase [unclassified Dysgonomonas]MDH6354512.1 alginate O-acetyltransferase complex protein AlgI [Dysgonomonas sp. PH5-45]MDH6387431.1 alginate O-acetyltransferase complex protein AlgI [Dysgonomonas sp. PH5-37]
MFFNSLQYALFLPFVFIIYWFLLKNDYKKQNVMLLVASYVFYGCWDWRFLFLLAFSTLLCYMAGTYIHNAKRQVWRKTWLVVGTVVNLAFLGFFKYYNFFIESFAGLISAIGFTPHLTTLSIVLPVGISFYTFHGLSYVFDIYYRRITPTKSVVSYSLFVAFFPLLVAGPIERATHLLPQIEKPRSFDYHKAIDGLRQILWGLFKKVVIADQCAMFADEIFNNSHMYSGSTLVVGALFFTMQIYGDFSGYSDIALGSARLLGFDLLKNFNFPYFSRDIAEFWRRWHISLSSWFKDYLYIPLGGSRRGMAITIRNTFIIFLVSGFWHGANWTFIVWGGLHALYIMPSVVTKRNRRHLDVVAQGKLLPSLSETGQLVLTFALAAFAWIFFRASSMEHALNYIKGIFTARLFAVPQQYSLAIFVLVVVFIVIEWLGRENNYAIEAIGGKVKSRFLRWIFYYAVALLVFLYSGGQQSFIYFQF